ncbi:unnamed protein product [Allacma fusca]|uniref:Uncharacterized protein n=1 Tax=Allacma fusca TaxID=39272 RepID=A0A8J2LGR1_9HEXA|nr:unnamed protein product [Allacma fusca]
MGVKHRLLNKTVSACVSIIIRTISQCSKNIILHGTSQSQSTGGCPAARRHFGWKRSRNQNIFNGQTDEPDPKVKEVCQESLRQEDGQIAYGVAHEMKAKIIVYVNPTTPIPKNFDTFGLPEESSWLPDWYSASRYWFLPYHFSSAYNSISWYISHNWYLLPKIDALLKELYGKELPLTQELM